MKKTIILSAALFFFIAGNAWATLVSHINTDTSSSLDITWDWDENGFDLDTPELTNWEETIKLYFQSWSTESSAETSGGLIVNPEGLSLLIGPFYDNQYETITDTTFSTSYADYHFIYNRGAAPSESLIQLTASQFLSGDDCSPVPLPGAAWLLGSGLAGLVCFRRKHRK